MKRKTMVESQVRRRGVVDPQVLKAMEKVQRHLFVPPEARGYAYEDHPLPIGFGQTISQPYIVGYMTEKLQLRADDKVLEIGTGSGYQAAVVAEIVREVYTVETIPELSQSATALLHELGYMNVHIKTGDGYQGWPEHAPYDAIIVTAAPADVPAELVRQLKIGGRMILPVGRFDQTLLLVTREEAGIRQESVLPVRFVPMVKTPQ